MKRFFRVAQARLKFSPSRQPQPEATCTPNSPTIRKGAWVLEHDIPAWGFRRGEQVRVFPNAPIYLDDIVALRSDGGLKLARYRDEYIGSVAGLAVRV